MSMGHSLQPSIKVLYMTFKFNIVLICPFTFGTMKSGFWVVVGINETLLMWDLWIKCY